MPKHTVTLGVTDEPDKIRNHLTCAPAVLHVALQERGSAGIFMNQKDDRR